MLHQPILAAPAAHPASKWTAEARIRFLDHLARKGNVRAACARVGASAETAYRLRRRDEAFARGWAAAMVLARRAAEQVLAERAIDGIEEEIYYRGELVGTRRRYDTRLLLAHLARLDRAAEDHAALADAERFDELLAGLAGERLGEGGESAGEVLPLDRCAFAEKAAQHSCDAIAAAWAGALKRNARGKEVKEVNARFDAQCEQAVERAAAEAERQWDDWIVRAHAAVDAALAAAPKPPPLPGLPGNPLPADAALDARASAEDRILLKTPSTPSTPATAEAAAGDDSPRGSPLQGH